MEKEKINKAIKTLQILRNKHAIAIMSVLKDNKMLTANEVQTKANLIQSSCSLHLNRLAYIKVLSSHRIGTRVYYSFNKSRHEQIERMIQEIG